MYSTIIVPGGGLVDESRGEGFSDRFGVREQHSATNFRTGASNTNAHIKYCLSSLYRYTFHTKHAKHK